MKLRILAVVLFILAVLALANAQITQASAEPVFTVDKLFTALSAGQLDAAVAVFAEDAVVENLVRDETYRGAAEIGQMLQAMQREGRQYEIVRAEMVGDTVTLDVEISDRGQVWGEETIIANVKDSKIQTLDLTEVQLKLW